MSGRRKHEEEHENEERWLLTYADLITLLMVLFVVMYSMSKVDTQKFQQMAVSLSASFNTPRTSPMPLPGVGGKGGADIASIKKGGEQKNEQKTVMVEVKPRNEEMDKLAGEFREMFKQEGLENSVNIEVGKDGKDIVVRLADSLLFEGGSADLSVNSKALIDKLFSILQNTNMQVQVEGHTDNVPVRTGAFQSNWGLSTARAVNVVEHLLEKFEVPPERLSASGYSEYHPVAPNDTPENRAKNRRVEFVITKPGEEKK